MIKNLKRKSRLAATFAALFVDVAVNHRLGLWNVTRGMLGKDRDFTATSIDITPNCNLRCQHCYLFGQGHQKEKLSDKEFLRKLDKFEEEHPTILHCTWVGGEPLIKIELLKEGMKRFPVNWVITNGTLPLTGKWPDFTFVFISLDGSKEIHNQIRRPFDLKLEPGETVYDRVMKNAAEATVSFGYHMVINQLNMTSIPKVVEDLSKTRGRCLAFSFHTPMIFLGDPSKMSTRDKRLWLDAKNRRKVVKMLLELKADRRYKDFILLSEDEIKRYLPEYQLTYFGKNCPLRYPLPNGFSVDAIFKQKLPCVMGATVETTQWPFQIDCDKCGCVMAVIASEARFARLSIELCSPKI